MNRRITLVALLMLVIVQMAGSWSRVGRHVQTGKSHFGDGLIYVREYDFGPDYSVLLSTKYIGFSPESGKSVPGPGPFSPNVGQIMENPANPAEWFYSYNIKGVGTGIYRTTSDIAQTAADLVNSTEVVAPDLNTYFGNPTFQLTKDGQTIYYNKEAGDTSQIWRRSTDPGATPKLILDNVENSHWALSPDGSKIGYTTVVNDGAYNYFVHIADSDGNIILEGSSSLSTYAGFVSWHPDSTKFLYFNEYYDFHGDYHFVATAETMDGTVVNSGETSLGVFNPDNNEFTDGGRIFYPDGSSQWINYPWPPFTDVVVEKWTPSIPRTTTLSLPAGPYINTYSYSATVSVSTPVSVDTPVSLSSGLQLSVNTGMIKAGESSCRVDFQISADNIATAGKMSAVATGASVSPEQDVTAILIKPVSVTVDKPTITSNQSGTATISFDHPAGSGGLPFYAWYDSNTNTYIAHSTIPEGSSTATFSYTVPDVASETNVVLNAALAPSNFLAVTTTIKVEPTQLQGIGLNNPYFDSGSNEQVIGTVEMSAKSTSDRVVQIHSDSTDTIVPATVTVPTGASTATFNISFGTISRTKQVHITGTYDGTTRKTNLDVNPVGVQVTILESSVSAGTSATGTVTVGKPAGPKGYVANLFHYGANVSLPKSVSIPPGKTSATFTIDTSAIDPSEDVYISATVEVSSGQSSLHVFAPKLNSIELSQSTVPGGVAVQGTINLDTLDVPPGAGGFVVSLHSSNSIAASVPSSVTIAPGQYVAKFTVKTAYLSADKTVSITATHATQTKETPLTITTPVLTGLTLSSGAVVNGAILKCTVSISGPANPEGVSISLISSDPAHVHPPNSIRIPAGSTSATFTIPFQTASTNLAATIKAVRAETSFQAPVRLLASTVKSLTFNPTSIFGGQSSTATITLAAPADSGQTVTLTSSMTNLTVTFHAGATTQTVAVGTLPVSATKTIAFTATTFGTSAKANLTVKPTALKSVTLSPATIKGGTTSAGTVTLESPAPPGGYNVTLKASAPASVPSSVSVPAGQTSATFTVTTNVVKKSTKVTITATGGTTKSAVLTLNP